MGNYFLDIHIKHKLNVGPYCEMFTVDNSYDYTVRPHIIRSDCGAHLWTSLSFKSELTFFPSKTLARNKTIDLCTNVYKIQIIWKNFIYFYSFNPSILFLSNNFDCVILHYIFSVFPYSYMFHCLSIWLSVCLLIILRPY